MIALAVAGSLGVGPGDARDDAEAADVAESSEGNTAVHVGSLTAGPATGEQQRATADPSRTTSDPPPDGETPSRQAGVRSGDREHPAETADLAVPARSGEGKRIVYDISDQRVWLVRADDGVARTYLVSGGRDASLLEPGRYEVYSKSRHATAFNHKETMAFMVRFAHGRIAPIGFHDIPRDLDGVPVQTRAQLGTQQSAGCIRQARPDAVALWQFAEVGSRVVVVA